MSVPFSIVILLVVMASAGCGSRRPPTTQPPVSRPSATPPGQVDTPSPPPPTVAAPELEVTLQPSTIRRGESVLLTWTSSNAGHVIIEPNIGRVDPASRIKLFPDATTVYSVTAVGPGGEKSQSVTVTVLPDASAGGVREDTLVDDRPLPERFDEAIRPVFFDFDKADLSKEAKLTLDANIRWLLRPANLSVQVVIEGHCDERGSAEYNLALGDRRAEIVRQYLVAGGVDPSRTLTVSLGEDRPFVTGTREEEYALNRRAHFVPLQTP